MSYNKEVKNQLLGWLYKNQEKMIEEFIEILSIPAVHPHSGGNGEAEKADRIMKIISDAGFDEINFVKIPDESLPQSYRPNIIAKKNVMGAKKTLWLVVHTDVVSPGNLHDWTSPPFSPEVRDGKIYGRGTEDNGQAVIGAVYAAKALIENNFNLNYNLGIAFVADEETGSEKGISAIIEQNIFHEDDIILVPDSGEEDSSFIEIAEKSILWLKFTVKGIQSHASIPVQGKNPAYAASLMICELKKQLSLKFGGYNSLFNPPESTFEVTKREANVESINVIPPHDIFYYDCRVLPEYSVDDVKKCAFDVVKSIADSFDIKVSMESVQETPAAKPTSVESEVVTLLKKAIEEVYGVKARAGGIGGGTCAGIFRRHGFHAAVWQTVNDMAHQPNEYAVIENIIRDAAVFAIMYL